MSTISKERKIELLTQFNQNEELKEVLKEELLAGIYTNGVIKDGQVHDAKKNWALSLVLNEDKTTSNEILGSKLVAIAEGIRFVESSFAIIEETYKPVKIVSSFKNKAR